MNIDTTEYKGHTLLVLRKNPTDKFPFQFGLAKAQLILASLDAIKEFVAKESAKAPAA
jgi:hypothetical protein